jgi:hypothetical protein
MNKVTQFFTMTGLALVAGAAIGAAPAVAAPAAPSASGTKTTASASADRWVKYFRSERQCRWAGHQLPRSFDWDCEFVYRGPHRFQWRLTAERDRYNHDNNNNNNHKHDDHNNNHDNHNKHHDNH